MVKSLISIIFVKIYFMSRFIKLSLLAFIISLFFISCEKELSEENGNLPGAPDTTNNGGGGSSCGTPSGISGISTVAGSVNLTWTAVTGAISYSVQYRVVGTTQWYSDLTSSNAILISGLVNTSTYEFQVQSVCTTGTSVFSGSTSLVPSGSSVSCNVPGGLNATGVTETEATLNWLAVSGASTYNVQYRVMGSTTWMNTFSTTNSVTISGLSAGTDYDFEVQTVCSGGQSGWSGPGMFTTTSQVSNVCKACSYQPWCNGTIYNYIDTTDGVPATASETITILGTTMINGTMYDITLTQAGDTVYHNCDSVNQVTKFILDIDPLGTGPVQITSTLIKSNLGVAPWFDNYSISGYNITVNYSLVGAFASRTVLGIPYNDVIQIHQEVSAVISPLPFPTTVSTVDYYYAAGIGLIEQISNDTFPGSTPSITHRVLETYFIP
jgi:hypothetical protein